jgi:hypothetical protein
MTTLRTDGAWATPSRIVQGAAEPCPAVQYASACCVSRPKKIVRQAPVTVVHLAGPIVWPDRALVLLRSEMTWNTASMTVEGSPW